MRTLRVALIALAGLAYAQEGAGDAGKKAAPGGKEDQAGKVVVRRLESVSWNPVRAELTWLVSVWDVAVSLEQPAARERYVIHLDDAVMEFEGQSRSFDLTEAKHVRSLMDVISTYAVESTVWWGYGEGAGTDGQAPPAKREGTKSPDKNDGKEAKPKAAPAPVKGPVASAPGGGTVAASGAQQ